MSQPVVQNPQVCLRAIMSSPELWTDHLNVQGQYSSVFTAGRMTQLPTKITDRRELSSLNLVLPAG